MRDNEQRSLGRLGLRRDFMGAREQWLGYERIVPYRFAINPNLSVRARRNRTIQFQLPRNHCLGEITFADEIRDDENLAHHLAGEKKSRVAQARFLFPKCASDIGKNLSPLDFMCVCPSWRARIRIQRRSMSDNQKRALVGSHRTKRSTACPERNSNASNAEWKAAAAAAIDTATEE